MALLQFSNSSEEPGLGLSTGTQLGPYEIVSRLGAGGMGEVYRARDFKLGRSVAIKVLPSDVARDPEKLDRLEREAKLLASLNHPNIASIYGFEDSDKPGLNTVLAKAITPYSVELMCAGSLGGAMPYTSRFISGQRACCPVTSLICLATGWKCFFGPGPASALTT